MSDLPCRRTLRPDSPVDLRLTLGPLCRGRRDPTMKLAGDEVWRATRSPAGPLTLRVRAAAGELSVDAWGPGAEWGIDTAPTLLGLDDDATAFAPAHPMVADLHRRLRGLRLCRSAAVTEALVPTVLEQKVQGSEARRSYAGLVRQLGEPAPGPLPLLLPPSPPALAATPYFVLHRFNVERRRADTIRRVATVARRLDECRSLALPDAYRRLRAVPGVGAWSAAEVAMIALGDADAVSVGDYHLPNDVSWAFAGEPRGDDERMLELLEPFRPHRGRVLRLLGAGGIHAPRFGPRMERHRITAI